MQEGLCADRRPQMHEEAIGQDRGRVCLSEPYCRYASWSYPTWQKQEGSRCAKRTRRRLGDSGAAPATASGSRVARGPLAPRVKKALRRRRPTSQETCHNRSPPDAHGGPSTHVTRRETTHIEPGLVEGPKILLSYATAAAAGVFIVNLSRDAAREKGLGSLVGRSVLTSALVFTFFEVMPHFPVGISEVHFIFAST